MQPESLPPHNLDAEESVLGAMMLSPSAVEACMEVLTGREFYRDTHTRIFNAIVLLYQKGDPVDQVSVANVVGPDDVEHVHEVAALVPAASNARHYAEIVRTNWLERGLMRGGNEIRKLGLEGEGTIEERIARADEIVGELQNYLERHRDSVVDAQALVAAFRAKLESPPDESYGVAVPFPFLKPLQPSRLYVLGGYQGDGKTALSTQFMAAACEGGANVGLQSLEMARTDITDRLISYFGVPSDMAQAGVISEAYRPRLETALETISKWRFQVNDDETATVASIRRFLRRGRFDFLIIDHLHTMPFDPQHERESIAQTVRQIRALAKEFQIPIMLLSQLSRGLKHDPYPRPTKRDLFGANAIENEAAHIWLIWRKRDKLHQAGTDAELIIAKNRFGQTGWQPMWFQPSQVRFHWGNQT